jgi:hypothetical protein
VEKLASPSENSDRNPEEISKPQDAGAEGLSFKFNCGSGLATLDRDWSPSKKAWCCKHQSLGCPESKAGPPPSEEARPATAGLKAAATEVRLVAPPELSVRPTESPRFDCDAGLANFEWGWSDPKKEWCCHHKGKGCEDDGNTTRAADTTMAADTTTTLATTTSMTVLKPFNCDFGLHNAPVTKQRWCCTYERKGCPAAMFSGDASPKNKSLAPGSSNTKTVAYDCKEDYPNWKTGWSSIKKQYCCRTAGRACEQGALEKLTSVTGASSSAPLTTRGNATSLGDKVTVKSAIDGPQQPRWERLRDGSVVLAFSAAVVATGVAIALVSRRGKRLGTSRSLLRTGHDVLAEDRSPQSVPAGGEPLKGQAPPAFADDQEGIE